MTRTSVACLARPARQFAFLLLVGITVSASAQERAKPIWQQELWSSLTVQGRLPLKGLLGKAVNKRIRFAGELGYRSADTFFAGRQLFTDLGLRYKFSDHFNVVAEHRIAFRVDDSNKNRSGIQLNFGTKWNRFDLGYRVNYQHNYLQFGKEREILRNKMSIEYNIRKFKLDPEISSEFFTWIGYLGARHLGARYSIGTSWSPTKAHTIGFKFVHDREYGVAWPTYRWIYSLNYTLNLRDL